MPFDPFDPPRAEIGPARTPSVVPIPSPGDPWVAHRLEPPSPRGPTRLDLDYAFGPSPVGESGLHRWLRSAWGWWTGRPAASAERGETPIDGGPVRRVSAEAAGLRTEVDFDELDGGPRSNLLRHWVEFAGVEVVEDFLVIRRHDPWAVVIPVGAFADPDHLRAFAGLVADRIGRAGGLYG